MAVTETRTIVLWCICSSIVDRRLYRANNNAPVDLGVEENTSETMTSVKHEIFKVPLHSCLNYISLWLFLCNNQVSQLIPMQSTM